MCTRSPRRDAQSRDSNQQGRFEKARGSLGSFFCSRKAPATFSNQQCKLRAPLPETISMARPRIGRNASRGPSCESDAKEHLEIVEVCRCAWKLAEFHARLQNVLQSILMVTLCITVLDFLVQSQRLLLITDCQNPDLITKRPDHCLTRNLCERMVRSEKSPALTAANSRGCIGWLAFGKR